MRDQKNHSRLTNAASRLGDSPGQEISAGKGTSSAGSCFLLSQGFPEYLSMPHNLFVHAWEYKSAALVHSGVLIKPDGTKRGWSHSSQREPRRTKVLTCSQLVPSLDPKPECLQGFETPGSQGSALFITVTTRQKTLAWKITGASQTTAGML